MKQAVAAILACCVALALQSCSREDPETPAASAEPESPPATLTRSPAPPGAAVFFITPTNGAEVSSPVTVKFGVSGVEIAPAGTMSADTGHHHLLIDTELANPELPVPSDSQHLHFGKGQTETTLELEPGEHRLQLVLGDGNHIPHDPPITSAPITVTVR